MRMISEGPCHTENWSNDAENSALTTEIHYFKIYYNNNNSNSNCNNIFNNTLLQFLLYFRSNKCRLCENFLQKHKKKSYPKLKK